MFGREHADHTFSALFALPVSRRAIASAKYVVLLGRALVLSTLVALVTTTVGLVADVGIFYLLTHGPGIARLFGVAFSTTVLGLTMGWVASIGRGYLPAIAALVLTLIVAQMSVIFGTAGWFPFAVPGLLAVAGAPGVPTLSAGQIALVPFTAAVVMSMTVRWWHDAQVA